MIYYINDVTIENEQVLVEYGANGTATGTYEYGLQRLSVEHVNEAKEYYLYNGTGNVTQTTAQNGSAFLRYTYDPFGNVTSINAPMTVDIDDLNRYTYNGEDYDYNTGLQYLRARYYSTGTGNFISQDTYLGQTISPLSQNRYTYCHNNPVMYDDPSWHWLGAIIVVGFVGYGLYNIGDKIYDAHTTYQEESKPYINELNALAESGTIVDTCGIMLTTLPDNVVYDEFNCVHVMFNSAAEAQLYREKVAPLMDLMYQRNVKYGHAALDGLGMLPGVGIAADLSNAVWYLAEGDIENAALSAIAMAIEPICAWAYNNWLKELFSGIEHHVEDFFKGIFKKSGVSDQVDDFFESVGDLTETTVDSTETLNHEFDNVGQNEVDSDFYVGPNGKVLPNQYKEWIGTNRQKELLSQAENPQLKNAIKQLYRDTSFIGDGGTADVIRFEKQTGLMLGKNGGSHIQKGADIARYIENKILPQDLSASDRELATKLLEEIKKALGE